MNKILNIIFTLMLVFLWGASIQAKEPQYIGVKSCVKCHKKDREGEQLAKWKESKHAEAYNVLLTDKAREAAKKVGVSGEPSKSEACLVCHTTGLGVDKSRFKKGFKVEEGVQCEGCHGAGGNYKKKKVMKKITAERGKEGQGDSPTAKLKGLIFPDENTCKSCHAPETKYMGKVYKNPSFKEFDYAKFQEKIKHPIPPGKK